MKIAYNPKTATAITANTANSNDIVFDLANKKVWAKGVRIGADYDDITNKPSSLPANGGNADTVDNWHKDNIQWTGYITSSTAGLSSYWFKMYDVTITSHYCDDITLTFLVSNGYNTCYSIFALRMRQEGNTAGAYKFKVELRELVGNCKDRIIAYYNNSTGNIQLWGNVTAQYGVLCYTVIKKIYRTSIDFSTLGTLTAANFTSVQTQPSNGYTKVTMARVGQVSYAEQASSATVVKQLSSKHTFWGNEFNGTQDVEGNIKAKNGVTVYNGDSVVADIEADKTTINNEFAVTYNTSSFGTASEVGKGHVYVYSPFVVKTWSLFQGTCNIQAPAIMQKTTPQVTNKYDLGASDKRWANIYGQQLLVDKVTITAGADIYYQTTDSDQKNLVLNIQDDNNAYIQLALNGTSKSYFDVVNSYWTGRSALADKWTTPRTFKIGNSSKIVDGSGDVSWTLAELGIQNTWRPVNINGTSIGTASLDLTNSNYIGVSNTNGKVTFNLIGSTTIANQAILSNGTANGWKLQTLNIENWNKAWNWVNNITTSDTDGVINKWNEIVNFLAGIDNSDDTTTLNTFLNSKLSIYSIDTSTDVSTIKNTGLYYCDTDAHSGTLTNTPFKQSFALLNIYAYGYNSDLRRARIAFDCYGNIKISNDRGTAGTGETWYNILTSNNSSISGSTIKINGQSITVNSSTTADSKYVKKAGDTMTGQLTIAYNNFAALVIQRNNAYNYAAIQFRGSNSVYGYIGMNTKDSQLHRHNSTISADFTILDTSSTYVNNGTGYINGSAITQVTNATKATLATSANKLNKWFSSEVTDLDQKFGDESLRIFSVTTDATNAPPLDASIIQLAWDTTDNWNTQLSLSKGGDNIYFRGQNLGTWGVWKTVLHSGNSNISNNTITIGGNTLTFKAGSGIGISNSSGIMTIANNSVLVQQHSTNNINYPLVWSNVTRNASAWGQQLFKSSGDLYYNPQQKKLTIGGSAIASGFVHSGVTENASQYVLTADGGSKAISDFSLSSHNHDGRYSYAHQSSFTYNEAHNSNYVTFDESTNNGLNRWVNGFVSTHGNYLSSYIINVHRSNVWYVGWSEINGDTTKTPNWQRLALYSDIPSSLKNPNPLIIQTNGTILGSYDGSSTQNYNITYENVGAAAASHNHTSLNGVTRINFNADATDSCYIGTTVSSGTTTLDFYLSDDAKQESFRWIFKDCDSSVGLKTIMQLIPTNNANTALKLYDSYVATQPWANSQYVTSLNTNGIYLTWTKNDTTNNIIIPGIADNNNHEETPSYNSTSYTTANAANAGMLFGSGMYMTRTYTDPNMPCSYGNVLNMAGAGSSQLLLSWSGNDNTTSPIYYRSHRDQPSGGWGPWKRLLFSDENAVSATKLQAAVTLWGQSFNGTQNISGDMTEVGNISMNGGAQIKRDCAGAMWYAGRNVAILRETSSVSSQYHTLWSLKTANGSWELGEYNTTNWTDVPVLTYITDTNYKNNKNNVTYQQKFQLKSGTIALTSDIPKPTNYYWADIKVSSASSISTTPTFGAITWNGNPGDVWSDGTDSHPWYGYNWNANKGVYSTTLSDYYGITIRTDQAHISLTQDGKVGINTYSPSYPLDVTGAIHAVGDIYATGASHAAGFNHSSVNSNNYILLAGGGYMEYKTGTTSYSRAMQIGKFVWIQMTVVTLNKSTSIKIVPSNISNPPSNVYIKSDQPGHYEENRVAVWYINTNGYLIYDQGHTDGRIDGTVCYYTN